MFAALQPAVAHRPAPGSFGCIALRDMGADDVAPVVAIERRVKFDAWRGSDFQRCLDAGYVCPVAETAHGVIGYGVMSLADDYARIANLCIAPDRHGRGLGRMLLASMLHEARVRGARLAFLEVRAGHQRARKLYRAAGFRDVGRRYGYYLTRSGWEDAVIMARPVALRGPAASQPAGTQARSTE
ncbi:MAG: ribosomal protein S18-alanine N-acetyltransferase [Pseudomonadota bacterium]|nr:MAG: ribosomal protein S18-alanine N-acetyltransferase [Pseudomonadota bacterium]